MLKRYLPFYLTLHFMLCMICSSFCFSVNAVGKQFSSVMSDLSQDVSFNLAQYPSTTASDVMILDRIAESTDKELFVYVYQPGAAEKPLSASKISLSTSLTDPAWDLYDLELIDRSGVFAKYLVKGFSVSDSVVRIYDISELLRPSDADDSDIPGGSIDEKHITVAKRFIVSGSGDKINYNWVGIDVVEVTGQYAGFMRYGAGVFGSTECDAHFIAFSTDRHMDRLLSVDIVYTAQNVTYRSDYTFDFWKVVSGKGNDQTSVTESLSLPVRHPLRISAGETGTFQGDGWFAAKYEWDRIQTVEDFKAQENIHGALLNTIDNLQWVLRFTETDFTSVTVSGSVHSEYYANYTKISNIGFLRFSFETDGKSYTMAAVSDLVTGDDIPDNPYDPGINFKPDFNDVWSMILVAFAVVLLLVVFAPILPYIIRFVVWVVMLPFKAIGALFKKRGK